MEHFPDVDAYIESSETWPEEVAALRTVLLGCGLDEGIKWGKPCYGHEGANIAIVQEMKGFVALMFFKGALLDDPDGLLVEQGPNSRSARRIELTSTDDVAGRADEVRAFVAQAVANEQAGLEVEPAPALELAPELQERLAGDTALAAAFESLTPGRQREYNLHVADAKQSATRERRIDRYVEAILAGKGMRDR